MAHEHDHKHHDHDHHHHDGDDHHHHHGDHDHDWHSQDYVADWNARDAARLGERRPIIDRMIAAVPYVRDAEIAVFDVGGGSGVLAEVVLGAFPRAKVTLQDYSQPMLDRARARFADRAAQLRYVLSDLRDPTWMQGIDERFDLAVSGIAIHNLQGLAAIAACYEGIHGLLKGGACFLDYDHFDRVGGVPLHQHSMKVAGFRSVDLIWHDHPTAILKANV
jgi:2-polyprenyl-3-methyl-5-hydroxy-6-metoxy-1,4-benzoquinol methylase